MKTAVWLVATLAFLGAGCNDDNNNDDGLPPITGDAPLTVARQDIVSDQSGALARDATLVNAWGLAFNPVGAAWVNAADDGTSKVYNASGDELIAPVTIPGTGGQAGSPTGQVFNADDSAFEGDRFIFVTEEGTIAGWVPNNGTQAVVRVDNSRDGDIYKGVTIGTGPGGTMRLFAADFFNATVDVFDASYHPVAGITFNDPDLPEGYAPFNVRAFEETVIVTYAEQDEDKKDDVKGDGKGFVDLYNMDGVLLGRLASGGELNAPWGIALAPGSFGAAPNRLLISNFGDGKINVYDVGADLTTLTLDGQLLRDSGQTIAIDGLWALEFGVDAGGFDSSTLYFTAGPDDETHGVFGALISIEQSTTTTSTPGY